MASEFNNLSKYNQAKVPNGREFSFAVIVSEYNDDITFAMRDACCNTLLEHGVLAENIVVEYAPGAYELPFVAQQIYLSFEVNAVIVLGCVIKGDTDHDIYINHSVSKALMDMTMDYETPFIFGLLTTNNHQQALDRAGGKHGNKGVECAIAALKVAQIKDELIEEDDAYLN